MNDNLKNEKIIFVIGGFLILTGSVWNEWLLKVLFSPDDILDISKRIVIWGFDLSLIGLGLLLIYFRKKIQVINIVVFLGTLIICLFFVEIALRLIEPGRPEFKMATVNPNRTGSYRLMPNLFFTYPYHGQDVVIETNSLGMRWREVFYDNPLNKTRIAFVGDSFTFGESASKMENSFVGIFDSLMDQQKFEVLNFGVIGYGLSDIALQIKEDILPFEPDYIILMTFNGNDFRDTYLGTSKFDISTGLLILETSIIDSKVPEIHRERQENPLANQQSGFSIMNLYLYKRSADILARLEANIRQEEERRADNSQKALNFAVSSNFTSFTFWSQKNYPEVAIKAKEQSLNVLTNIKKLTDDNDIQLLIVSIPFEEQVYASPLVGKDHNGKDYDINLPQGYVKEWANINSVPYLDLLPLLRASVQQNNAELYPQHDMHFNNEGHFIVGYLTAGFFQEVAKIDK